MTNQEALDGVVRLLVKKYDQYITPNEVYVLQQAINRLELLESIVDVEMEGTVIKQITIKKRVGEELKNGK